MRCATGRCARAGNACTSRCLPPLFLVNARSRPAPDREDDMPGTLRVTMRSATAWPWQEISVATDENWDARIRCQYQVDPDQWVADLPTGFPAAGLQLKFLCNGVWQHPVGAEGNLRITPDRYHEVVHFEDVRFPGTEGGEWPKPALQFFRPDRRDDEWD